MTREHTRACVALLAGLAVLYLGVPAHSQSDTKTIIVVDDNGARVNGVNVYRMISFAWDEQTQTIRPVPTEPLCQTDTDGAFAVPIDRLGGGSVCLVANESLDRMAFLYVSGQDRGESATIRLERAARLKAVFESPQAAMTRPGLDIGFRPPRRQTILSLIAVTYALPDPVNRVSLDVPCPSGCRLDLSMSAEGGILPVSREIGPLQPGQVLDLGTIEPRVEAPSDSGLLGRPAPELQIAEWVKGEPATLAELKGKVVLLDFWALWCVPCCQALPGLASLHEKYAKDGLVIIAIHDTSQTKASLLAKSPDRVDLSKLPFRIAMDSPAEGGAAIGAGRTIDAYDVTGFPTSVLINREGQVEGIISADLEHNIRSLLYTRSMAAPSMPTSQVPAQNRTDLRKIAIAAGAILVLAIVLISLYLLGAKSKTRRS